MFGLRDALDPPRVKRLFVDLVRFEYLMGRQDDG
jgi:hypothetical protein